MASIGINRKYDPPTEELQAGPDIVGSVVITR